jgi:DNA-binding NarL/FixJ family response regulator/predicted negative regulator of RcsB-dependent stress response
MKSKKSATRDAYKQLPTRQTIDAALSIIEQERYEDVQHRIEIAQWCHDAALGLGYTLGIAKSLLHHGWALATWRMYEQAIPVFTGCLAASRRAKDRGIEKQCLGLLTGCEFQSREYENAAVHCALLADFGRQDGDVRTKVWATMLVAVAVYGAQQYDKALTLLNGALVLSKDGYERIAYNVHLHIGKCLQQLGQVEQARQFFTLALKGAKGWDDSISQARSLEWLALNQVKSGNKTGAIELIKRASQIIGEDGSRYSLLEQKWIEGQVFFEMGLHVQARKNFEEILKVNEKVFSDHEILQSHEYLAKIFSTQQNWKQAFVHLQAARALELELLHAAQDANLEAAYMTVCALLWPQQKKGRAMAVLPQLNAIPQRQARPARAGPRKKIVSSSGAPNAAELTPRQLEILELIADGTSNAQIAAQLNISINTVRFHLVAVFTRLGVKRRSEAVARAMKLDLLSSR